MLALPQTTATILLYRGISGRLDTSAERETFPVLPLPAAVYSYLHRFGTSLRLSTQQLETYMSRRLSVLRAPRSAISAVVELLLQRHDSRCTVQAGNPWSVSVNFLCPWLHWTMLTCLGRQAVLLHHSLLLLSLWLVASRIGSATKLWCFCDVYTLDISEFNYAIKCSYCVT